VADIFTDLTVSFSLFADDMKMYTYYELDASHIDLQTAIDRLTVWAELWQLQLAIPKCFAFRITNPQWRVADEFVDLTYSINGTVLPFNDQVRDLGVYHDSRLKYNHHISYIVHSAFKRAILILKCFRSRDNHLLKHAFCVYVRPLLEFSCQIWFPHYKYLIDKIESVQRFFTRKLSDLCYLPYNARLRILGLETLERRRLVQDLILYYKILHGYLGVSLQFKPGCGVTRGNSFKLAKQNCSCDVRKYFYSNRIVDVWNSLPDAVVAAVSVYNFKIKLRGVDLCKLLTVV
jgi:hypothetical protein